MSRGNFYRRNLPHWQPEGAALFITWRLYGSLPRERATQIRTGKNACATENTGKNACATENTSRNACATGNTSRNACATGNTSKNACATENTGPFWLNNPSIAQAVVETIQKGETPLGYFVISAFVVMPNHVHILIQPHVSLARITKGIKGASARKANEILGRTGKPFWQDESFDHWIRTQGEYESIHAYIERNPVEAGLVKEPREWPWSSANIAFKRWKEAQAGMPVPPTAS